MLERREKISTELKSERFNLSPFTKDYRDLGLQCASQPSFCGTSGAFLPK